MITIILVVHVVLALGLIALVLMQQGKGAEAGAAFGGGSSQTMFGSRGSASFFGKLTAWLAAGFFLTSLGMAWYAAHEYAPDSGVPDTQLIEEHNRALPNLDETDDAAPSGDQSAAQSATDEAVDSPIALPDEGAAKTADGAQGEAVEDGHASGSTGHTGDSALPALETGAAEDQNAPQSGQAQ
ncbi:preprotein translocase subunit SecG [Terasakiispira papahanaumokuakeensis]|uniref:Protein-export membrane protein SecG n=1 Tax=Terasakiispira papahanaumokuakeensis TaxID=197479 RepID=A0A1E2VCW6_9GAMM|nr:preprotein translocase subunit SecG [Terasakiispira papahanaumokuakeensis]